MAEAYIETDVDSDTESEKSEETNANATVICKGCNVGWEQLLREAPFNKVPPLCGHCPNSNYIPPARTQTGTLGHFFSGAILPFFTIFTIFISE